MLEVFAWLLFWFLVIAITIVAVCYFGGLSDSSYPPIETISDKLAKEYK